MIQEIIYSPVRWCNFRIIVTALNVDTRTHFEPIFSSVPEYDVTSPFQVDEKNRFLSHNLNIHARQKRNADEPRVWYYNVKAFGMSLHLNLTKNEDLMSPWLTVQRHENGTVTNEDPPQNTFYNGHVNSEPGSSVAVSKEGGLVSRKERSQRSH